MDDIRVYLGAMNLVPHVIESGIHIFNKDKSCWGRQITLSVKIYDARVALSNATKKQFDLQECH